MTEATLAALDGLADVDTVMRINMLERQMSGRAGFQLLRKRVLLAS